MAYQIDFCVFVVHLLIRKTTQAYHRKIENERSGGFITNSVLRSDEEEER